MASPSSLAYPVFWIERADRAAAGMMVVHRQSGFLTFGRFPKRDQFVRTTLYTSDGNRIECETPSGKFRWRRGWAEVLENLILPGLLYHLASYFVYFGPRVGRVEQLPLSEFKTSVHDDVSRILKNDKALPELWRRLGAAGDFRDVLLAIERWQYDGGVRDKDGHPEGSPEYSP